jgi:putative transposase
MEAVKELAPQMGARHACEALGVARSSYYHAHASRAPRETKPRPAPPRALSAPERQRVLDVLHSERFVDVPPAQVRSKLLDEGVTLCSERTMYRILESHGEVRERRNQLRHPSYAKPELLATGPNQVWSWDLTKLRSPAKWVYYYLYVLLDIYSRYVVGWLLAHEESGALAKQLIAESCEKQGIGPGQLTIHADRGAAPKAKTVAQLYVDLDIRKSFSRPQTSDDNPFSEAQFKTLKYRPEYPKQFDGGYEHALGFCRSFFGWYNPEHHHSGIAFLPPEVVHYGRAEPVLAQRQRGLDAHYAAHPERYVNGPPRVPQLPRAVWINPPEDRERVEMVLGLSPAAPTVVTCSSPSEIRVLDLGTHEDTRC